MYFKLTGKVLKLKVQGWAKTSNSTCCEFLDLGKSGKRGAVSKKCPQFYVQVLSNSRESLYERTDLNDAENP